MKVKDLKKKLDKLDENLDVIIEAEKGAKFHLLTAKKRCWQAGHKCVDYCWLPIGRRIIQ